MKSKKTTWFTRVSRATARATGHPLAFGIAAGTILVWAVTGPMFAFSDTWQLVINTGTTIVTFLMVFLIQNTQNRDSEALQIKIDELIRCVDGAQEALMDLEEMEEKEIRQIRGRYQRLAEAARTSLRESAQ
ncbi:MAG: low affinity iron permease family protein [Gemmatimonadales bacterium]|nr:low affinity iron permease family protein [Gemmatimonadales bacterium]